MKSHFYYKIKINEVFLKKYFYFTKKKMETIQGFKLLIKEK